MCVIILCGIPGSGKTTYARRAYPRHVILSADDYFMVDGVYRYDEAKLTQAHGDCLRRFIRECQSGGHNLVIDNTNTKPTDIAPYHAIATAYGYEVDILVIEADPEVAFRRNIHGVPLEMCRVMASRLKGLAVPSWWHIAYAPVFPSEEQAA
jgi:predicted kinase